MDKQTYENFRKVFTGTNLLLSYAMMEKDYDFLQKVFYSKLRLATPIMRIKMEAPGHKKCVEGNYYAQLSVNPELDEEERSVVTINTVKWVSHLQDNEIDIQIQTEIGISNTMFIHFTDHKDIYEVLGTQKLVGKKWIPDQEQIVPTLIKSYYLFHSASIEIPRSEHPTLKVLEHLTPTQIDTEFNKHLKPEYDADFIKVLGLNLVDQLFLEELDYSSLQTLTVQEKASIGIVEYDRKVREAFAQCIDAKIPDVILSSIDTKVCEHYLCTENKDNLLEQSVVFCANLLNDINAGNSVFISKESVYHYKFFISDYANLNLSESALHEMKFKDVNACFAHMMLGTLSGSDFEFTEQDLNKCNVFELMVWLKSIDSSFDVYAFVSGDSYNSDTLKSMLLENIEPPKIAPLLDPEQQACDDGSETESIPAPSELVKFLIQEAAISGIIEEDEDDLTAIDVDALYKKLYLTQDTFIFESRLVYIEALLQKDDRLYSSLTQMSKLELYLDHAISKAEGFQFVIPREGSDLQSLINLRLRVHLLEMHNVSAKVLALSTDADIERLHDIYFHV